jgi:hypothetical protein
MIWNIVLLFLVFGAAKKKINPYASAAALGAIKGVLYFIATRSILGGIIGFVIFGGLAFALVYLLGRLDRKEATEEPYPKYGTRRKQTFKWEYVPLSGIVLFLIFGEMYIAMALR